MIVLVEAMGYKCLKRVSQRLRPFQVLVGPNASGKSTFLDAVAFLRDLLDRGVEEAIWRRASSLKELLWRREGDSFEVAVELAVPEEGWTGGYERCRYEVRVGVGPEGGVQLLRENFWAVRFAGGGQGQSRGTSRAGAPRPSETLLVADGGRRTPHGWRKVVYRAPGGGVYFRSETSGWNAPFRIDPRRSALANLPEDEGLFPTALWARRAMLSGISPLALNSQRMREPCRPDAPRAFQPDGSNFPLAIRHLKEESGDRFRLWLDHVRQLLPDLEDLVVREREVDRFLYVELELRGGLKLPSWTLSDGTLRFMALTLIAYLPGPGATYLVEEPENGIHPRALELVFQSLSSVYDGQVLMATHSPLLVALAEPADLLCFSLDPEGATSILSGDLHPALRNWRRDVSLGELLAAGVLG